ELQLVQKIVDCHMRLNRIAVLDNNMLNFGLLENLADGDPDDTAIAHAQARSWIAQQMSFEKLGRYEGRLSRQLLAYTKELERLQPVPLKQNRARPPAPRPAAAAIQSAQNPSAQQNSWSSASFCSAPATTPNREGIGVRNPAPVPEKEAA